MKKFFIIAIFALMFLSWNGVKAQDPCEGEGMFCDGWIWPNYNVFPFTYPPNCTVLITWRYKICTNPLLTRLEAYNLVVTGECDGLDIKTVIDAAYQALMRAEKVLFLQGQSTRVVMGSMAPCWEKFYNAAGVDLGSGITMYDWWAPCTGNGCCYTEYTLHEDGSLTDPVLSSYSNDCNYSQPPLEYDPVTHIFTFPHSLGSPLDNLPVYVDFTLGCQPICNVAARTGENMMINDNKITLENSPNNMLKYCFYTTQESSFNIIVTDLTGRQIEAYDEIASRGYNFYEKDCSNYSVGTYFFSVYKGSILVKSLKFIVF